MRLPRVTDHAVLRYLERVRGLDVAAIRQHIAELCAPAATVGSRCVKAEGVQFELDRTGGVVVTIVPNTGMPSATKRAKVLSA